MPYEGAPGSQPRAHCNSYNRGPLLIRKSQPEHGHDGPDGHGRERDQEHGKECADHAEPHRAQARMAAALALESSP